MVTTLKRTSHPASRGLVNTRPSTTLVRMESTDQRKRRLAVLVKRARQQAGFRSAAALAEATDGTVSESTIARLESMQSVPLPGKLNALEMALQIPLGSMEAVLSGTQAEFHSAVEHAEHSTDGERVTFTKEDIRVLARALGAQGLHDWALSDDN